MNPTEAFNNQIMEVLFGPRTNTFGEPVPKPPATAPDSTYRAFPSHDADMTMETMGAPPSPWGAGMDQNMILNLLRSQ